MRTAACMPCHAGLHACNAAMHMRACIAMHVAPAFSWRSMPRAQHRYLSFFYAAVRLACMHACMLVCARLQAFLPRNRGHGNILQAPHAQKRIRACQHCPFAMERVEGLGSWCRVTASAGPALLSKAANLRQTALAGRPNPDI